MVSSAPPNPASGVAMVEPRPTSSARLVPSAAPLETPSVNGSTSGLRNSTSLPGAVTPQQPLQCGPGHCQHAAGEDAERDAQHPEDQ